jgi:hypothetical protein
MDTNPEKNLLDVEMPQISYGTFWPRVAAIFIDGLVVSPLVLPLTYYNMMNWKSPTLYLIVSFILLESPINLFVSLCTGLLLGKKC